MLLVELEEVWSPVVYFGNAIIVRDLESFGTDQDQLSIVWLDSSRHVMRYSIKFTVSLSCKMNFYDFPFDDHKCQIMLINWAGASYRVQLSGPTIYTYDNEQKKEVGGESVQIQSKKLDYLFGFESLENSVDFFENGLNYSMVLVDMKITRTQEGRTKIFSAFHMPTGIFALTSLISFFIEPEQVPGRMGLLITLCLIIINSYNSIDAPSRRGFSPIEVWFVGNLFPILLGILQFGVVLFMKKYLKKKDITVKDLDLAGIVKRLDLFTFAFLFGYLIIFNISYWLLE